MHPCNYQNIDSSRNGSYLASEPVKASVLNSSANLFKACFSVEDASRHFRFKQENWQAASDRILRGDCQPKLATGQESVA